jgi:hypothetical protein
MLPVSSEENLQILQAPAMRRNTGHNEIEIDRTGHADIEE